MKSLLLLAFLPSLVFAADEAQLTCDLARAQAEVTASELKAPAAFASGGNQLSQKTIAVGVSQSLSGIVRANRIQDAAEAQCASAQSSVRLEQYTLWSTLDIQKRGAIASLSKLNEAIDLATANVSTLKTEIDSGVITLDAVADAQLQLDTMQHSKASLLITISNVIPSQDYTNVDELIRQYESDQATSAELTAKASAHSGWDFTVAVGENKPIGGGAFNRTIWHCGIRNSDC